MCPFRWIKFQCWLVNNPQTISSGLVWKQGAPNPWVDYHVPDQNEHKLGEYHPIHRVPPHTHPNDSDSDYLVGGLEHGYYFPFHRWENPSHWLSYLFKMVKTTNQLLVIYWVIYPSGHEIPIFTDDSPQFWCWNIMKYPHPRDSQGARDLQDELHMNSSENLDLAGTGQVTQHRGFGMVVFEHRMRI